MCSDGVVVVCHSITSSIISSTCILLSSKYYVVVCGVGVSMYGVAVYSHVYMCYETYTVLMLQVCTT